MAGGRPSTLTTDLIAAAVEVAQHCPSYVAIGRAVGVSSKTIRLWMQEGRADDAEPLKRQFCAAIQEAILRSEVNLTRKIAAGEARDAAWLLTHSPFFRDEWSDAAADRRVERRTMAAVVDAIASAKLPPEQERLLLLNLQARGLGAAPAEPADADG
ncbi:MAG: hypothetical protein VKO65_01795 [Cyanobacteriota bacterium]|nr:hypothetical protein [Cyanobacteriota bacterium]